jgi:hypothetical protein
MPLLDCMGPLPLTEQGNRYILTCQRNKHTVPYTKMAMEVTDTPYATCEKISLDCMGPLPATEQENRYILTCHDQLSKHLEAIALPNQAAVTIARALVDNILCSDHRVRFSQTALRISLEK